MNRPAKENNATGAPQSPGLKRLRKLLQLVKYFVISSVILTLMEVGYLYWLLSSRWNLFLTRKQMAEYAQIIKQTEPLPDNFLHVYTTNIPHHLNTTMSTQVFVNYGSRFFFRHTQLDEKPHCFCDFTYDILKKQDQYLSDLEWDGRLQDLEFGFGMEKFANPSDCFGFVMNYKIQQLRRELTPKQYPFFFEKTLAQFTEDEMIEFVLLLKSRGKINRFRDSTRYAHDFEKYKGKLQAVDVNANYAVGASAR